MPNIVDTKEFERLLHHVGHKIAMVAYGKGEPVNISVECETCNEVIIDFEPEKCAETTVIEADKDRIAISDSSGGEIIVWERSDWFSNPDLVPMIALCVAYACAEGPDYLRELLASKAAEVTAEQPQQLQVYMQ